jgi:hypothetical protein
LSSADEAPKFLTGLMPRSQKLGIRAIVDKNRAAR